MTDDKPPLPPISDAEEARIQEMIASDPDNPEWANADCRKARPFAKAFPALAKTMRRNVGGRHDRVDKAEPRSRTPTRTLE